MNAVRSSDIQAQLKVAERRLLTAPRRHLLDGLGWANGVPGRPGIYAIWATQHNTLVYVGQTANLRARCTDLGRLPNHSFRRMAARRLGIARDEGEVALSKAMATLFTISFMPFAYGRAEFEEYLIMRHRRTLWNKTARRIAFSGQYSWVTPA